MNDRTPEIRTNDEKIVEIVERSLREGSYSHLFKIAEILARRAEFEKRMSELLEEN